MGQCLWVDCHLEGHEPWHLTAELPQRSGDSGTRRNRLSKRRTGTQRRLSTRVFSGLDAVPAAARAPWPPRVPGRLHRHAPGIVTRKTSVVRRPVGVPEHGLDARVQAVEVADVAVVARDVRDSVCAWRGAGCVRADGRCRRSRPPPGNRPDRVRRHRLHTARRAPRDRRRPRPAAARRRGSAAGHRCGHAARRLPNRRTGEPVRATAPATRRGPGTASGQACRSAARGRAAAGQLTLIPRSGHSPRSVYSALSFRDAFRKV